ncbi:MAG: response regulator transcription factor [Candidatus Nomurabacteria bacterium]|nr:response regulator transcription factor [Candidatus Nomurabacteria bacterium]
MRILIVEDNEKLAKYTKQMLEEEGYATDTVSDGETAERIIRSGSYDLVILDIMLPKKDGISVCKSLRNDNINLPIIMITAKGEVNDKILGLDSGADDYLVKPFDMKELLARVRAILRRPQDRIISILKVNDITLDNTKHTATQKEKAIPLTLKEYTILEYLMRNADQVVTREQLLEHCWDFAYSAFSNITDVYIKQLRKKLKDSNEKYIQTIRGVGYTFKSK